MALHRVPLSLGPTEYLLGSQVAGDRAVMGTLSKDYQSAAFEWYAKRGRNRSLASDELAAQELADKFSRAVELRCHIGLEALS